MTNLFSAIDTFKIKLGEEFAPVIEKASKALTDMVRWVTASEARMEAVAGVISGVLVGGIALATGALWAFVPALTAATGGLNIILPLVAGGLVAAWVTWGAEIRWFLASAWNKFVDALSYVYPIWRDWMRLTGEDMPQSLDSLRVAMDEASDAIGDGIVADIAALGDAAVTAIPSLDDLGIALAGIKSPSVGGINIPTIDIPTIEVPEIDVQVKVTPPIPSNLSAVSRIMDDFRSRTAVTLDLLVSTQGLTTGFQRAATGLHTLVSKDIIPIMELIKPAAERALSGLPTLASRAFDGMATAAEGSILIIGSISERFRPAIGLIPTVIQSELGKAASNMRAAPAMFQTFLDRVGAILSPSALANIFTAAFLGGGGVIGALKGIGFQLLGALGETLMAPVSAWMTETMMPAISAAAKTAFSAMGGAIKSALSFVASALPGWLLPISAIIGLFWLSLKGPSGPWKDEHGPMPGGPPTIPEGFEPGPGGIPIYTGGGASGPNLGTSSGRSSQAPGGGAGTVMASGGGQRVQVKEITMDGRRVGEMVVEIIPELTEQHGF